MLATNQALKFDLFGEVGFWFSWPLPAVFNKSLINLGYCTYISTRSSFFIAGWSNNRQSSYQQAVGALSPNNSQYYLRAAEDDDGMPNLNDPEVAMAAVKIQSAYRGFQTRSQTSNQQRRPTAGRDTDPILLNHWFAWRTNHWPFIREDIVLFRSFQ